MTANMPLMIRLKFLVGAFISGRCIRSDGTINRFLLNLLDRRVPASASASASATPVSASATPVSSSDISVDPSRDLWFRLYVPSTTDKLPLVVYFHGGGFSFTRADSQCTDDLCRTLAERIPAVVASVNYRLAPEHKFPCQYDDGFDSLKFINDRNHGVLPPNTDLDHCFLAGDSAGGNITHHVAVRAGQERHVFDKISLAGIVAVQPFFGGEERTESELRLADAHPVTPDSADVLWRMFLPAGANRNHAAANVFGGGGDDIEEQVRSIYYPRTLVVVGGTDPLQDRQRRYAKGLEKCGKEVEVVEYDNGFHGFFSSPELPEFESFVQDVSGFINKH